MMSTEENDDLRFTFSETEIRQALGLVLPDGQAEEQARILFRAMRPDMDWATSEEMLLCLSLASESGNEKVQRIRKAMQAGRKLAWAREQQSTRRGGEFSPEELAQRWELFVAGEDRRWTEQLEAMREVLRQQGKLPPE